MLKLSTVNCQLSTVIYGSDYVRVGAFTHMGMLRQKNEDSFYIPRDIEEQIPLFVIADGMGGCNAGEIASKEAIDSVVSFINENYHNCPKDRKSILKLLTDSIMHANDLVFKKSLSEEILNGMGTTLIVVLVHNNKLYIGHIGDSRVYAVKNNRILQLTRDHSYVEQLVERGIITREQASAHPRKNYITRAIGCEDNVEVDLSVRKFFDDEIFILCTDGLTNMISDEKIMEVVLENEFPQAAVEELIKSANSAGGLDNITVIVLKK